MRWQIENRGKRRSGKVEFKNAIDQQRRRITTHQCLKKNGKGRRVFRMYLSRAEQNLSSKVGEWIISGGPTRIAICW